MTTMTSPERESPLLAADGLTVHRAADGALVLPPTDLRAESGQVVVITGPSGAGKTTLLHALLDTLPAGLRRSAGTVRWQGTLLKKGRSARKWRRIRCGLLGQDPGAALHPLWRVGRLIGEDLVGDRDARAARVAEQLDLLGLPPEILSRRAGELSGGQAQRVALARALVADPALLVLDEPTSAMDPATAALVRRAVAARRGSPGRCVVLVTHDERLFGELADVTVRVAPAVVPRAPLEAGRPGPGVLPTRSHADPGDPLAASSPLVEDGSHTQAPSVAERAERQRARRVTAAPRQTMALSARGLLLTTPDGAVLLEDCDLDLPAGSATAVVGTSGVGKTTLLHALVGRRPAAAGTLLLHGTPLPAATRHRGRDQLRAVQLAGQSAVDELNPAQRVGRAVARPLTVLHGLDRAAALAEAQAVLAAVGLPPGIAARRPHMLSGGQRQRAVLARALAARPDVLLLDEPTASLDPDTARSVLDLLDRRRETGTAILAVTHDPAVAARADEVLALRDGHLLAIPPDSLGPPVPSAHLPAAPARPSTERTEPPVVR
ncbi:ABC transporter ATP-binding protein [Streptomyces sp. NL15-2K]|uniref:ABC transporter ATP-binding protein n=1 Tax=Streptomyces sp. NL15-2K TaxID=376149 RepID=UPI000FF99B09|nr:MULTISPECIES: ATP-binding cassette domain-containing protein [Actinomycetes]WKX13665.1 ATP-binding cassette domain-containing protein [Kutzneria buriramensis]GCB44933.1 methionine ABC transporter ATP-binding protein [Streptomyces sp. NL15-2K]